MRRAAAARLAVSILGLLCASLPAALLQGAADARAVYDDADRSKVQFDWKVEIPLRDGIRLAGSLYRPRTGISSACILSINPYMRTGWGAGNEGFFFASHGFSYIVVDARGRGDSEGLFRPFIQEAKDGYDVVEWLARQPYCNGKVTMWGLSYMGYDQWATAKEMPPHLLTIVPVAAPMMGYDFMMRGGISYPYLVKWRTNTAGKGSQSALMGDNAFWADRYREYFASGRPFQEFDQIAGNPSADFQEWISHPSIDAYWDAYGPTVEQYQRLSLPILTITGMYDDCQPGALQYYRQHMRYGSEEAKANHFLIIGPWDHVGTWIPKPNIGGVTMGPASLIDLDQIHLQWYRWTLAGGTRPEFLKKRVAYYVAGADEWRYADTLDQVTDHVEQLSLDSRANANDIFRAGQLTSQRATGKPDSYRYDPNYTEGPEIDAEYRADAGSFINEPLPLALRGRELVYHTPIFRKDTDLAGFFRLSAWISIDRPDTDLFVSVYDVAPDGTSIRVANDLLRARYRNSLRQPELVRTAAPLKYDFDRFTFAARRIAQGHTLRLVIAPMGRWAGTTGTTFAEKNYGSGGDVAKETAKDGAPVTVSLFHDPSHPSVLFVPLARAQDRVGFAAE